MDQAECVYFKSASMASNNREGNGAFDSQISWDPLDSKSIQKNHACWLKMKFCFSSMLMTSCMSKTKQAYKRYRDLLKTEFKIKELEKAKHIVGVRVEFVKSGISLSQRQDIEETVRTFSFHEGNKVYT